MVPSERPMAFLTRPLLRPRTMAPGLAILLTVLSINLIGEGLNDALNPRLADL